LTHDKRFDIDNRTIDKTIARHKNLLHKKKYTHNYLCEVGDN